MQPNMPACQRVHGRFNLHFPPAKLWSFHPDRSYGSPSLCQAFAWS